jgi:hypothetical protein
MTGESSPQPSINDEINAAEAAIMAEPFDPENGRMPMEFNDWCMEWTNSLAIPFVASHPEAAQIPGLPIDMKDYGPADEVFASGEQRRQDLERIYPEYFELMFRMHRIMDEELRKQGRSPGWPFTKE